MDLIKPGDIVSISHYSGLSPFKSVVVDVRGDTVLLRLTKEFAIMNFLEGDPVVFGIEKGEDVLMGGCNITGLSPRENMVELKVENLEVGTERRQCERYPVSLYADVKTRNCKKKQLAIIKNISCYGMLIYSKGDFLAGEQLEVDIYMDKTVVHLKTNITRKEQGRHYFEYGLEILYENRNSLNFMKDYIKRLEQEQIDAIRRLSKS